MNKRSFKDIEEEMKQLANAYEAPFDEQAWVSMEALLDKDEDRKKPPFFWFWLLLPIVIAGVAGGYYLYKNKEANTGQTFTISKTDTAVLENKNSVSTVIANNPPVSEINAHNTNKDLIAIKPGVEQEQVISAGSDPGTDKKTDLSKYEKEAIYSQINDEDLFAVRKKSKKSKNSTRVKVMSMEPVSDYTTTNIQPEKQSVLIQDNNNLEPGKAKPSDLLAVIVIDSVNSIPNSLSDSLKKKEVVIADSVKKQKNEIVVKNETGKPNKKNNRGFYFIAAAGADAGGVKLFSMDKITARFGIAVGYQFSKRLSVQTGFFAGNKKYVAGPGDYTAKAGTYWSVVDITKVDASCRVFEIPLQLRYDFQNGYKTNFFITAGLSSYVMKKEDYHYYYYRYGSLRDASASYTGNQHLFSVMRVAAGFERKISGPFSLQLSPGISVPLAGVGEGQVKLFSTDLMIGLKYTPNRKK